MTTTNTTTGVLTGIRVNVDGTLEDVRIESTNQVPEFVALANTIGCDVFDRVALPDDIDVFVDDEGLYRAVHNEVLSEMVRHLTGAPLGYRLHGAGVFLGMNDEGDTLSLTTTQRATVAASWWAASPLAAL